MKQEKNNEMDVLLRSLARPGQSPSTSITVSSEHLDADELNSYAEGVLPSAARSRYTEHLADCDRCRGIVVQLAQSALPARESAIDRQKTTTSFWQSIAAFFSPAVLRYAVPAMGLAVVLAVTMLALRKPEPNTAFVAQNEPANSATPSGETNQAARQVNQPNPTSPTTTAQKTGEAGTVGTEEEKNRLEENRKALASVPSDKYDATAAVPAAAGTPQSGEIASADSRPTSTYSIEPAPAPPAPKTELSDADRSASVRKEQPAENEAQTRRREDSRNASRDEPTHGPSRGNVTLDGVRSPGLMAERGGPRAKSKKDSGADVDERTVSGRHFRREGNAWVDTAYSGRATINVARGSEQFRALVADEPGLRAIAQQLSGEVLVVWKGKAYRFR